MGWRGPMDKDALRGAVFAALGWPFAFRGAAGPTPAERAAFVGSAKVKVKAPALVQRPRLR
eukprot:6234431-Lingulodinium_polyedra.AAC.1